MKNTEKKNLIPWTVCAGATVPTTTSIKLNQLSSEQAVDGMDH